MTNKDVVVAESEEHASYGECINEQVGTANAPLPFGFTNIDDRVDDRHIAKHRQPITSSSTSRA